jgi:hypothetical protein
MISKAKPAEAGFRAKKPSAKKPAEAGFKD